VSRFVDSSGSQASIKWAALLSTTAGGLYLAVVSGFIHVWTAFVDVHAAAFGGLGGFLATFLGEYLGGNAEIVSAAWATATRQAMQAGPLGPVILSIELLVVIAIVRFGFNAGVP
jgi:hypothetical protein